MRFCEFIQRSATGFRMHSQSLTSACTIQKLHVGMRISFAIQNREWKNEPRITSRSERNIVIAPVHPKKAVTLRHLLDPNSPEKEFPTRTMIAGTNTSMALLPSSYVTRRMRVWIRSKGTDSIGLDTQNIRQGRCFIQLSSAYRRACSEN